VVFIDNAYATLKRIYRRGAEIELRPANSQMEPFRVPAYQVEIQGIFRGLLRPTA
jgi:repressor LexA